MSRPAIRRTNLRAVVSKRRSLAGASPLPKSILAAGVATMGAMTYAILREGSAARDPAALPSSTSSSSSEFLSTSDAVAHAQPPASAISAPFLTLDGKQVSASNVPKYVLANSGLSDEQKLSVALCRRQAWLRATQFAPFAALWSYAGIVLVESAGWKKFPRGSRTAAPLCAAIFGATFGAYYGGLEGKPMMNAALRSTPIAGVHHRRGEQEDALVHVRAAPHFRTARRCRTHARARPLY